jgi:hypothetical protein
MKHINKPIGNPPPEVNPPLSAEDRRPNDRPFYISDCCPKCDTVLIYDDLVDSNMDWDDIFFDEFACPKCNDGCYLDWTPQKTEEFKQAFDNIDLSAYVPLTEESWAEVEALTEGVEIDE